MTADSLQGTQLVNSFLTRTSDVCPGEWDGCCDRASGLGFEPITFLSSRTSEILVMSTATEIPTIRRAPG